MCLAPSGELPRNQYGVNFAQAFEHFADTDCSLQGKDWTGNDID